MGGYFSGEKMEIPKRRGEGGLREIPSVLGVWIFSGTTHYILCCCRGDDNDDDNDNDDETLF